MNRSSRMALLIGALSLLTVVLLQIGWFVEIFGSPDPIATAWRDWIQFHRTALRTVSGQAGQIYPVSFVRDGRPEFSDGFFFLYPPPFIWITLPLAAMTRMTAYLACAVAVAGGTVLATLGILLGLGAGKVRRLLAVLGTMASAPWNGAVILGHLGALLLIGPGFAILAWTRHRPFLAGCCLSILLVKPNWGLPILAFLAIGRRWNLVGGFLLGGTVLTLSSLPLGLGLWVDWLQTMVEYRALVIDASLPWKQVTLFAAIQSLLQRPGSDALVASTWVALSLAGMGWTAVAWFRHGQQDKDLPRLLGVALLAILVFNPYAYFYDALLSTPAALVLWTQSEGYRSARFRAGAQVASLATHVWMYLQLFLFMDWGPSLAGIGFTAWLLFELADLQMAPLRA